MLSAERPDVIFTDVDDTLTLNGELPVESLSALYQLRDAGIAVIPVTGACAGWCDQIARLWPVTAVIGENGAFCIEKRDQYLHYIDTQSESERMRNHRRLQSLAQDILAANPGMNLASDNIYRRYDWALDHSQHSRGITRDQVERTLTVIHSYGIQATASSIHINMWIGDSNKKLGALAWLHRHKPGWDSAEIQQRCAYIGDSLNDEPMFAYFSNSVGVANIEPHLPRLKHKPASIMSLPGGKGFAQWVRYILMK